MSQDTFRFFEIAARMRELQKRFFAGEKSGRLIAEAKEQEKAFDRRLQMLRRMTLEPDLFATAEMTALDSVRVQFPAYVDAIDAENSTRVRVQAGSATKGELVEAISRRKRREVILLVSLGLVPATGDISEQEEVTP